MPKYDHKKIEAKWKKSWEKSKIYKTNESSDKPKYYVLDMFPYPSGAGLHVGHPKGYIATDIVARLKMMQGYNVLHPMGWDAFGLPAENYALKNKVHPADATAENIIVFKKQLGLLGFTYDWDREVNTTDPEYYKWTQWIFLQMFKKGLAFESYEPINWCPECKTGLANEDLEDGKCERCGSVVEQKPLRQWVLKITDYAERLLNDIDLLKEWPEPIKEMQRNWIGKSEGAIVNFTVISSEARADEKSLSFNVFTTRPDTLFGATYCVVAPENKMIDELRLKINNIDEVDTYLAQAKKKTTLERTELQKEKTGVELLGVKAVNPVNGEQLPIFVADYVLGGYGTGAIMAVPAHDERDFEFAKKYNLPIKQVVAPHFIDPANPPHEGKPQVRRKTIHAIIEHPSEEKILMLNWFTNLTPSRPHLHTLVLGGVDDGEDLAAAAIREAQEETGYTKFKFIRQLDLNVHTEYFTEHKGQNRFADISVVVLRLEDEKQNAIPAGELVNHEPVWVETSKLPEMLNVIDGPIIWDTYKNGYKAFTDDGDAINSDFLNDLSTPEAKEKMIKWLEEKGLGQRKIQYKLRDWVFSRQRYWGEPIPLVHCDKCAQRTPKVVLVHGLNGHAQENWFPWLKEKLEQVGYEVFILNLPNPTEPAINEWVKALSELDVKSGDRVFVVGHSLGAPAAVKFIEDKNIEVEKLILVAPTGNHQGEENWDNLRTAGVAESGIECIKKFNSTKLDWVKLKSLIKDRSVYLSDNDPFIPLEVEEDYKNLEPVVTKFHARGHFNRKVGMLSFPEILKEFPEVSKLNVGWYTIPEKDLPLELPEVANYEPTGTGESPLAGIEKWVNTKCPHCGGPAKRETNTMPQWAGSCWYYIAYSMPRILSKISSIYAANLGENKKGGAYFWEKDRIDYWNPVDLYVGGAEHATRHLIYARFWHKFLFDIGAVHNTEPFTKLQNVGLILAEDGRKMSKRWNNVINPDDVVAEFGADSMRLYEMFMGPFDQPCAWSTKGVVGCRRFLEKVWNMSDNVILSGAKYPLKSGDKQALRDSSSANGRTQNDKNDKLEILLNQTIKKVTEDISAMRFNTAISQLMIFANEASQSSVLNLQSFGSFLQLLAPFAPHLAEELWAQLGNKESIFKSTWPKFDPNKIQDSEITVVVQVNGKVRDEILVPVDISEADAKVKALASEKIQKWLEGKEPKKVIYVKGKLVSIVV